MKTTRTFLTAAAAVVLWSAAAAAGQAPAKAPIDLSGTWTLDTYLSDSPEQVAAAIRIDLGQRAADEVFVEQAQQGRSGNRMPRRAEPQRPHETPEQAAEREKHEAEQLNRLNELTTSVRYPAPTLTITQSEGSVTLADGQQQVTLTTDGKRQKVGVGDAQLDTSASWQGPQLVIEQDLGSGRAMTRTFSIVPTTKQLMIRSTFERAPREQGSFEVKQVYNRK